MAKIWPVYEGREPIIGGPWADIPIEQAIRLFDLQKSDFLSDPDTSPRPADTNHGLRIAGYKHIVVQIRASEARLIKWKPGFYRSPVKPDEAFGKLIKQALMEDLGDGNVLKVEYEPASDSEGQPALLITAVISPDGVKALSNGAALDALVRLQKRLREMREERTPILHYTTEAELTADDNR